MAEPPYIAYQSTHPYDYLELTQAIGLPVYAKQNYYAVVIECSVPRRTRNDRMCTLKLADFGTVEQGGDALKAGVQFQCFAPDAAQLPHVRKPGDIIRLHRAQKGDWGGLQLNGSLNPKTGFSFCLFDGSSTGGTVPYQCSSKRYHFDDHEAVILDSLREFSKGRKWQLAEKQAAAAYNRRISQLRPTQFFDAIVKVLAVDTAGPSPVVYVWDATDAPIFSKDAYVDEPPPAGPPGPPLPLHWLPLPPTGDLAGLPRRGTALPVVFHAPVVDLPKPGQWIKLRNCVARLVQRQMQAAFHKQSQWSPALADDKVLEEYRLRMAEQMPQAAAAYASRLVSSTLYPEQPLSTLRQVLADVPKAQPTLYRCVVRVLAHAPSGDDLPTMCVKASMCWAQAELNGYRNPAEWLFAGQLHLADATERLQADLFGRDAAEFFANVTRPCDLRNAGASGCEALAKLRNALDAIEAGGDAEGDGAPWLDICMASYFPDPDRPRETVRYRICHSTLT